jgi:hypothetical protein
MYRTPWSDSIKVRSDFSVTIGVFPHYLRYAAKS